MEIFGKENTYSIDRLSFRSWIFDYDKILSRTNKGCFPKLSTKIDAQYLGLRDHQNGQYE